MTLLLGFFFQVTFGIDATFYTTTYSQTGKGTYYTGNDRGGHCALWPLPAFVDSSITRVAMNKIDYIGFDKSSGCGICLEINGTGEGLGRDPILGPFIAFVNDECPECSKGAIDVGTGKDGLWDIHWKAINCPVGNHKISYMWEGSHEFYVKIQPRNLRIGIKSLEIQNAGSTAWTTATRTSDNFFECLACPKPLAFPLSLRLTGFNDEVLLDQVSKVGANQEVIPGTIGVQFESIGASPPTPLSPSDSGTNGGAIAGGVIGGIVGLLLIIAIAYYVLVVRAKDESV